MYPILNLRLFQQDLHWYLRSLEEVIIRWVMRSLAAGLCTVTSLRQHMFLPVVWRGLSRWQELSGRSAACAGMG